MLEITRSCIERKGVREALQIEEIFDEDLLPVHEKAQASLETPACVRKKFPVKRSEVEIENMSNEARAIFLELD